MTYSGELETILAAVWAHIPITVFEKMTGEEQSRIVAAYRINGRAEAVTAQESRRESQRASTRSRAPHLPRGRKH